jgi:superfamily II RNA helicase
LLYDFQERAMDAIGEGRNVLLSAPTGAGKTLVAEYAMENAIARGQRCIYTAPIKALSNQKYRDLRDGSSFDVGLMTGDVTINPLGQILIMTTEILRNAILETPGELENVAYVVFDEVHYMDDPERGSVWEETMIFAPPKTRFVCLSATISNIEELGRWIESIRDQELAVISSLERPVPLQHWMYTERRGFFDLQALHRMRRKRTGRSGGGKQGKRRRRNPGKALEVDRQDAAELLDEVQGQGWLPALIFAFSRRDCERLALENRRRKLLDPDELRAMEALQKDLLGRFQLHERELEAEVLALARHGLAYHHAGMLPLHKELVERLFTSGLIKMLFTTETFALGVNMPAKTVVFYAVRKFDGVGVDYLRTRDYMQMAGRAGRQGLDESGLVIALLGERDVSEAPMERMLSGEPEPVESRFRLSYSTLLFLLEHLGRERLHEAWEKSFRNFQLRSGTRKARERYRRVQNSMVDAHLAFLADLGYIEEGERLTPRGRTARSISGYELQITELLYGGTLEGESALGLAVLFVALVFEDRRRFPPPIPGGPCAALRRRVSRTLAQLAGKEANYSIPTPLKLPDWGLTPIVAAWYDGLDFAALEPMTDIPPGDICRTFRMALQLMRQVRKGLPREWDLYERLGEAVDAMNRDEVDARRQLELG